MVPAAHPIPRFARGIFLLALVMAAVAPSAAPYRPVDPEQILERVPQRAAVRVLPQENVEAATVLARSYIERSRREGDPRWLGYAEGVLRPWWQQAKPPLSVLLLRATLLQAHHQFDAALLDLDVILGQKPDDAQAWLTRATILRVQGRYPEAEQSCAQLHGLADDFIAALCASAVRGLFGELAAAVKDLRAIEAAALARPPALRAWYWAELSEALERSGELRAAEAIYQAALADTGDDLGLRAAYADFLLDQSRAAEVLRWIPDESRADALRLRRLLAQQALGQTDTRLRTEIADGFAAARRRDEELHLREEARYTLDVLADAPRALVLAQANWAVQHEPWDARLLLATAVAAGQPQAAAPVLTWMKETGYEDARLKPLLAQLP